MRTRKISASYIFSGSSGFLKNGILSLSEDGRVLKLTDTGGKLKEEAHLEHYNGILCPGFVNAHSYRELSHLRGKIPRNIRTLLVHNLFTSESDFQESEIEKADIYWVLCPKSDFYITGSYPGKFLMDQFSDRICIGTDSLASNDKRSTLEELLILQNVYPEITLQVLLSWATLNGARALGIDNWCGNFEEGKKPGVILIENVDILNLRLKKETRVKVLVSKA